MGKGRLSLLLLSILGLTALPGISRGDHTWSGGYAVTDSTQEGGPAYEFVDITETGTQLTLADDGAESVALPFSFTYFGEEVTDLIVSANGVLGFAGDIPDFGGGQQYFPDFEPPNGLLAGFWTDLDPSKGGVVAYETVGEEPNRRFIAMYKDVPHWRMVPAGIDTAPQAVTFEIVLFEGTSRAIVQMKNVVNDKPTLEPTAQEYVVGLEDRWGYQGATYDFGDETSDFSRNEFALQFEQVEQQEEEPPPPVEPIITEYEAPFVQAGENHTSGTNNLPDRHATAGGSAHAGGGFAMGGSTDTVIPTAHRWAAYSVTNTWHKIPHQFSNVAAYATVTVRFRLDELVLDAGGVGVLGGRANVAAWLRGASGRCAWGYWSPPGNDPCGSEIASIENEMPGHRGTYLPAPKEFVHSFDVYDPQYLGSSLFFGLTGYAQADGPQGAAAYRTNGAITGVTVSETVYTCEPPDGEEGPCVIIIGGTSP